MSQKSSLPQAVKSVLQALMSDKFVAYVAIYCGAVAIVIVVLFGIDYLYRHFA